MKSDNFPIYFCANCGQRVRAEDVTTQTKHLTGMAHTMKVEGKEVECGPVATMIRTADPMKQLGSFVRREIQAFDARLAAEISNLKRELQGTIDFHATLVQLPSEKEDLKPVLKKAVGFLMKLYERIVDPDALVLIKDFEESLDEVDVFLGDLIHQHPWAFDQPWVRRKKESPDDQSESERS